MKMGKKILFLMSFIMVAILAACSGAKSSITLESVTDYSNAVINKDDKKITISVDNAIDSFDLGKIKTKELVTIIAYSDSSRTKKIEGNLSVAEGENTYYLKLSLKDFEKDFSVNWVLVITRAKAATPEKTLLSIEINKFKEMYFINDEYTSGSITLIYSDESTETKVVTEEMISGFDTSTVGKKAVEITYLGKKVSTNINVLADSIADLEPSEISDEVLKPIFTFISAAFESEQISGEAFEAIYQLILDNFPEEKYQDFKVELQRIGLIDSELEALALLVTEKYNTEIAALIDKIIELSKSEDEPTNPGGSIEDPTLNKIALIIELLAQANVELILDLAKDILNIVPTYKLVLLLEMMETEDENIYYVKDGEGQLISLTKDEYVVFLREKGLDAAADFLAQSSSSTPDMFKDRLQVSYNTIDFLKILLNCDMDIILSITESVGSLLTINLEDIEQIESAIIEITNIVNKFGDILSYLDTETINFENQRRVIEFFILANNEIANHHLSKDEIVLVNLLLDNASGIAKTLKEITEEDLTVLFRFIAIENFDYSLIINVARLITKIAPNFDSNFITSFLEIILPGSELNLDFKDIAKIALMDSENLTDSNKVDIDKADIENFLMELVDLISSTPDEEIVISDNYIIFIPKGATKVDIASILSQHVLYYKYDEDLGEYIDEKIILTEENVISLNVTEEGIQSGVINYNDISAEFSCIVYDSSTKDKFNKYVETSTNYIIIQEVIEGRYAVQEWDFSLNYSYEGIPLTYGNCNPLYMDYISDQFGGIRKDGFKYRYCVDLSSQDTGYGYLEFTHDAIGTFYLPFMYEVLSMS